MDIWTKNVSNKKISKNLVFLQMLMLSQMKAKKEFLKVILKWCRFSRNIDSFGDVGKKRLAQSDLKITSISVKCWYLCTYGQTTICPSSSEEFLPPKICLYFDIFESIGRKRLLQSYLKFTLLFSKWWYFGIYEKKDN